MSRVPLRLLFAVTAIALAGSTAPAVARSMESGDADVVQHATPAVVNFAIWKMRPPLKAGDPSRRVKTYGSGFIIDPTGIIVTNKHVIDGALSVTVLFSDGNHAEGKVVAAAAMTDLAVVKVNVDRPLPVLAWGDSDTLRVGEAVLSIGNPLGIGMSVSAGIVSALNRDLQDTPFDNYIQTDAAINHGNSGGPLVNRSGEVIGVDTSLYNTDPNGGFIGIGFAIPAASAKFVVNLLLDPSHPKAGWLGVTLQDLTTDLAEALGVRGARGAIIVAIDPNSPADRASLQPGDVLEQVSDEPIGDARAFQRAVVMTGVGKPVQLTTWRDGKKQLVSATVAEWPNLMPGGGVMSDDMAKAMLAKPPDPWLGLATITDAVRRQYDLDQMLTGVLVTSVDTDCEASDLGMAAGDVITLVQGAPAAAPADVERALMQAHEQHRPFIALLVRGKGGLRWISLSTGRVGT
jgi:serine protease Do